MAPLPIQDRSTVWISPKPAAYGPVDSGNRERQSTSGEPQRFIAGTSFFNYEAYGSLRPGLNAIELFSKQYVGLAVHVTLCGFSYFFFSNGFGRLLAEYLRANSQQQVSAVNYVLVWPQALSLFIGLVSDTYPVFGYRRKSYMILGWVVAVIGYGIIIVMDSYGDSSKTLFASDASSGSTMEASGHYPEAYLVVSLVAAIGIQIAYMSSIVAGVEYAQREQLGPRGLLMSTLVALYYFGAFLARLLVALLISDKGASDQVVSTVSMGSVAAILASVSIVAIPCVVFCFKEEPFENLLKMSLRQRLQNFWKFCHQNFAGSRRWGSHTWSRSHFR